MILIVCKDDEKSLRDIAISSQQKSPGIFGNVYAVFRNRIPDLQPQENLFIIAHGAFEDRSGNPVIGDKSKAFYLNGIELWNNINIIFPVSYQGSVFIDACQSADHDNEVFSFIETFYSQFNTRFNGQVFGKNGASSGLIAVPGKGWKSATLDVSSASDYTQENQIVTDNNVELNGQKPTKFRRLREFSSKRRQLNAALAGFGDTNPKLVTLTVPGPDPSNKEAVKYFTFNQTGNIMMSTTDLTSDSITQSVRDVFNEVSVFFAAMTKAISTTINPDSGRPYSIYDYNALSTIISGSGLFVHVTEEDLSYTTSSFGADFSTQLIEGLLGLATGSGELAFAEAMIASMGSAGLQISGSSSKSESKVANIIFICEYLLGMPIVSAMVVYCDAKMHEQQLNLGPCFSESSVTTSWIMHKDTYMFVTPKFINEYSGDLLSVESNGTYNQFVDYLSDLILAKPDISGVTISDSANPAPTELSVGGSYQINGENFGLTPGKIILGDNKLNVGTWNNNYVTFSAPTQAVTKAALITLFLPDNTTANPDASSLLSYTVGS